MSKGQKKKITIKIVPGEAVFVAPIDVLQHIADTYLYMSDQSETQDDKNSWMLVCDQINEWIERTYYSGEDNYEEEW